MPVLFQTHICREDLRRNLKTLYVFGDNARRVGHGGQAREMRGEPNAVGIATKYTPYSLFEDTPIAIDAQARLIDQDMKRLFEKVKAGGVVVWPARGIGTNLAELATQAPTTYEYVRQKLLALIRTAEAFDKETAR